MGRLIIMGSGEMAPSLVATHRAGLAAAEADSVTVLDTPFGFQENVEQLTRRLVDFFSTSLQAAASVASLRSPNEPVVAREQMLAAIRRSRYVFAGPGSPSYALRVWRDAALAEALEHVLGEGGTVTFASAAALTLGAKTVPVYEIYKVGADPHWLDGIDLMGRLGLPCVVIPHWNNAEGGNHDTSRCYIGRRRLEVLRRRLEVGVIGVDEHSAAIFDFAAGSLTAAGVGGVTIGPDEIRVEAGEELDLAAVGEMLGATDTPAPASEAERVPDNDRDLAIALAHGDADAAAAAVLGAEDRAASDPAARASLRAMVVELAEAARSGLVDPSHRIAPFVEMLLELRAEARNQRDFATSDAIRDRLIAAGVEIRDTPDRVEWELRD